MSLQKAQAKADEKDQRAERLWAPTGRYLVSRERGSIRVPRHARCCRCQGHLQQQRPRKREDRSGCQHIGVAAASTQLCTIAEAGPRRGLGEDGGCEARKQDD